MFVQVMQEVLAKVGNGMLVGFAFSEIVEAGQGLNRDSLLFLFRAFEWLQNISDVNIFIVVTLVVSVARGTPVTLIRLVR